MIVGSFPLWQPTTDRQRIVAMGLLRHYPLPLFAERRLEVGGAPLHVGAIEGVTIEADRQSTLIVCHGVWHEDTIPEMYVGWYLVPDLDSTRTVFDGDVSTMTGNLIGATLTATALWERQKPIQV